MRRTVRVAAGSAVGQSTFDVRPMGRGGGAQRASTQYRQLAGCGSKSSVSASPWTQYVAVKSAKAIDAPSVVYGTLSSIGSSSVRPMHVHVAPAWVHSRRP